MPSRILTTMAVVAALSAGVPATAAAGVFEVRACSHADGPTHDGWTFATNDQATIGSGTGCAAGTGLQVFELMGAGPLASAGDAGWWTFAAPDGATVGAARLTRRLRTYSDAGWLAEVRADDRVLEQCRVGRDLVCEIGGPLGGVAVFDGLAATTVRVGGHCVPEGGHSACERGAGLQRLESHLYGATLTIDDHEPPAAELHAAGLASAEAWVTGPGEVTTSASDNTGVRRRELRVDGVTVAGFDAPRSQDGGCRTPNQGVAYTYARPCRGAWGINGMRTDTVDPRTWPQGTRQLAVAAIDTGGGETVSAPRTIRVDTKAPPAPAITTASGWATGVPTVDVTATDTSGGSALERVELEACWIGTCHRTTAPVGGAQTRVDWPELPDGSWEVTARVRDEAGHLGAQGSPTQLHVDRTAPQVSAVSPSGGTYAPGTRLAPSATAHDTASGIATLRYEVRTGGGPFLPVTGDVVVEAGRSYTLRAVATDQAGHQVAAEGETFQGAAPVAPPAVLPPALPGPAIAPPAKTKPAACRVRITSVRRTRTGFRVLGTVRAGRRVTATLTRGSRRASGSDRTTAKGRFALTVRNPKRARPGRATLRVRATSCAGASRTVTLRASRRR